MYKIVILYYSKPSKVTTMFKKTFKNVFNADKYHLHKNYLKQ